MNTNAVMEVEAHLPPQDGLSYGQVLDSLARGSALEIGDLKSKGIALVDYARTGKRVQKHRADVYRETLQAHHDAKEQDRPVRRMVGGFEAPLNFRYPCECEVATICVFPNGVAWASKTSAVARRLSEQSILRFSTWMALPVGSRLVNRLRETHARAVATAVIARTGGVDYTPNPQLSWPDQVGCTGFHVAARAGLPGCPT